jgi:hypothetical protein
MVLCQTVLSRHASIDEAFGYDHIEANGGAYRRSVKHRISKWRRFKAKLPVNEQSGVGLIVCFNLVMRGDCEAGHFTLLLSCFACR